MNSCDAVQMGPMKTSDALRKSAFWDDCCKWNENRICDVEVHVSDWLDSIDVQYLDFSFRCESISLVFSDDKEHDLSRFHLLADSCGSKLWEVQCLTGKPDWKEFKVLISKSTSIRSLTLYRCKWLTDVILEHLSKRFFQSFTSLKISDAPSVTNNGLFQLGKRCRKLSNIALVCCPKVTDVGIIEICKNNKISRLTLAHSSAITDKSLESIFGNSAELECIELRDCPKLTDNSIAYLFETSNGLGVKKRTQCSQLKSISISDSPLISHKCMLWLSAAAPHMETLTITHCPILLPDCGIFEIRNFTHLLSLVLGPVANKFDPSSLVESLILVGSKLTRLSLFSLSSLKDDHVAMLLESCCELKHLELSEIGVSTATVESICSYIPNLLSLDISGSSQLEDIALRCICTTCRDITKLSIHHCRQITDDGFTRLVSLRRLSNFSCGHNSTKCSSGLIKFLSLSPLKSLSLSGLSLATSYIGSNCIVDSLLPSTFLSLETLSLHSCDHLTTAFVEKLLNTYVGCKMIDLSDSGIHIANGLHQLKTYNPFLSWIHNHEFMGYSLSGSNSTSYHQYFSIRRVLRSHYGARLFQRRWRKFKQNQLLWKALRKERWNEFKIQQLCRIQSCARGYVTRRRIKHLRNCMVIVKNAVLTFVYRQRFLKSRSARRFYCRLLLRKSLRRLIDATLQSKLSLHVAFAGVERIVNRASVKHLWGLMKNINSILRAKALEDSAVIMWEINMFRSIFKSWRQVIGETSTRKQNLCKVFLAAVSVSCWNSRHHSRQRYLADSFRDRRLLLVAWMGIARKRLETRKADQMLPTAIAHFQRNFISRLLKLCFSGFVKYQLLKIKKRADVVRADNSNLKRMKRSYFHAAPIAAEIQQYQRRQFSIAVHHRCRVQQRLLFSRFIVFVTNSVQSSEAKKISVAHFKKRIYTKGYWQLKKGIIDHRIRREKNAVAKMLRAKALQRWTFGGWNTFRLFSRNLDDLYYQRYLLRLKKKIFAGLKINVVQNTEQIRAVTNELMERVGNVEKFAMAISVIIRFQANCRRAAAQRRFAEQRIQKLYAIQVLQNFFRTMLARKEYTSRLKKSRIVDRVREDDELDRMRNEDLDMHYFLYQLQAIINMQRIFRGWKGRQYYDRCALIHFREKNLEFYQDNEHMRVHHEAYKRAMIAREQLRHRAAIEIQRVQRGKIGREKANAVRQFVKTAKHAVNLQHVYRKRLARLQLDALRRDRLSDMRFKAARKQRGTLLRGFGFQTRRQQFKISTALESLGFDPISFNYRVSELMTETINDFKHIVSIFKREKALFKDHGINELTKSIDRRLLFANQGWRFLVHDAVRVIEPGHPFQGYTGTVVRIDESLVGLPLIEVKLDRFPRQTFVRMTTDPVNIYMKAHSLTKIMRQPENRIDNNQFRVFPSVRVDHTKKEIYAAWTIQRAYRVHRSNMIVNRRRYEHWMQCIARQWSVYYQLSDYNSLNTQGYNVAHVLGVRSFKPSKYDEIRHKLLPSRLTSQVSKPNESNTIRKELEYRYKDRLKFLQKCGLIKGKEAFTTGYERLTFQKKLKLYFTKSVGLSLKSGFGLKDLFGRKGVKSVGSRASTVSGSDTFRFNQFRQSPHVRYHKTSLYQGEWSGIPLFSTMRPHGEGVIVFLDAWGFAKEDKVLYLTILRCRHLNVMDVTSSDPYCDIFCNGVNLQTSVKWRNLNPQFYESFEIDVTNPMATLNIQVKDKDYFGSDDFMGQVVLNLSDFSDGETHQRTYQLKSEDITLPEDYDRGEIELRVRWAERIFEDEQARIQMQAVMLIRMQAWARRIASLMKLYSLRNERIQKLLVMTKCANKITSICRVRLAKKVYKKLLRRHKSAIKIQKRIRVWIAKRTVRQLKLQKAMAIVIQKQMRVCLAKAFVKRLRAKMAADTFSTVATIQKYVRRWIAIRWRKRQLEIINEARRVDGSVAEIQPVSSWLSWYGVDPEFGLKRNRRITDRLFDSMLKTRFVRLQSKFGTVYVDSYPPRKTEEEMLAEMQKGATDSLTVRDDFVSVFLPTFDPISLHRSKAIEQFHRYNHFAVLHLPTSVFKRKSVHFLVTIVQCAHRQRVAKLQYTKMLKVHRAISKFQQIFRRRYERQHKAALRIIAMFRMVKAKKCTSHKRLEYNSALKIQCSYRSFVANCKMFDLRSVEKLSVLRATKSVPLHGPEKCLEHRMDTFWMAESPEKSEIRIEFSKPENIVEIWIQTSTFSASPSSVIIQSVRDKSIGYEDIVERTDLPFLVGDRWHKFSIPVQTVKYFMVTFIGNYGDDRFMSVRQIRFIRSKESSVKIVKQPSQFLLDPGPRIGDEAEIVISCEAVGWPLPTYQWYRNNILIEGETQPQLRVSLFCEESGCRTYRCIKCKMVSLSLPLNAYHIKCGNCGYPFTFKEIEDFDKQIVQLKNEEIDLERTKNSLLTSKLQMESFKNSKYDNVIADLEERLSATEDKLQVLREQRFHTKMKSHTVNRFTNEGIYTCIVQNIRGGSLQIKRKSISAVVIVEKPDPFVFEAHPQYIPRQQRIRKKWNIYSSISGTFRTGHLVGIVLIRYNDGSFYEGPYVEEDVLDHLGQTREGCRARDHYGIYYLSDGRTFEGPNVDNHFDVNNLQSFYRLTFANGEVYEGKFCDEQFHGIGMFCFQDGSVYEGQWHRGLRFGHGQYRSSEGWTYEGFFDKNRRHRQGVMDWPDGSCYLGDWYYDEIKGKGSMITPLRDVYRGEFVAGRFDGYGELIYADGSSYVGFFKNGNRHGKGILREREGNEYFGHFQNDVKHGEHVVKIVIPIEEIDQDNYEIRIGVFENGNLVNWKLKFSNPIATKKFIAMFKENRDMFDSVYSMILAKNLPNLPEGIDGNNITVKAIILKIRTEAGMLVGQHALNQAKAQLDALFEPFNEKTREVELLRKEIESISMSIVALEKEASDLDRRYHVMLSKHEKDTSSIEQHWLDDPSQVRQLFNKACKKLDTLSVDEYFAFRNHRVIPVFVKKIFDALSCLLNVPMEWDQQQLIIADSIANGRAGDEEALRLDYKCKLSFMMKEYRVFDYVHIKDKDTLSKILADVRFRSDSFYIESVGPPGPILVEWIKTNFSYVRAAEKMYGVLNAAEEKRLAAFRFRAAFVKKKEEVFEASNRLKIVQSRLQITQQELEDIQLAILKANDLLQFIAGRSYAGPVLAKQDYYKTFERKLEEKKDRFTIEVCLRNLVDQVIERQDKELRTAQLQAMATGKAFEAPVLEACSIDSWIREEVRSQQQSIMETGRSIGYGFEPEQTDISSTYASHMVSLIVDIVTGKLNDALNDLASSRSWTSRKGKIISSRFLYVMGWKIWKDEAISRRDQLAVQMWESIFGDRQSCAIMAVESRVNSRMSSVARAQGKVWADQHKNDILAAEVFLSDDFAKEFETLDELTARIIEIENDAEESFPPNIRSRAACWTKLHPEEIQEARDRYHIQFADAFATQFQGEAGAVCFRLLHGLAVDEEWDYVDYAQHWKDFHMEEYERASEAFIEEMSKDFVDAYPLSTYFEAAKMIENDRLSKFVVDEEIKSQFSANPKILVNAYCWGVKNQGLIRKGKEMWLKESETSFNRLWSDLMLQTDNLRKGSALHVIHDDNGQDRFLGFRNRLLNKFAWAYGYIQKRIEDLNSSLKAADVNDPIEKIVHRVRPSDREKFLIERERVFLEDRRGLEENFENMMSKLSAWNSYFGWNELSY